MRSVVVDEPGGPKVLATVEVVQPHPGSGEVLVEVAASGVTFLDVCQRPGATPLTPPFAAGVEVAGVVGQLLTQIVKGIAQVGAALLVVAR